MLKKFLLKKIKTFAFIDKIQSEYPKAKIYLVGGAVRDMMLGKKEVKDLDFVVTKIPLNELTKLLSPLGRLNFVGKKFGILKYVGKSSLEEKYDIDIALPRKEKSLGYKGKRKSFKIDSDSNIPIREDLARRDFTINAMAYDIKKNILIDPYHGKRDLKKKIIKSVGRAGLRFKEDYSRMVRGIRFASQLDFKINEKTFGEIKKNIEFLKDKQAVSSEIVAAELAKSIYSNSSVAFRFFYESGLLAVLFPDILKLKNIFIRRYWQEKTMLDYVGELLKKVWQSQKTDMNLLWATLFLHTGCQGELGGNYFGRSAKNAQKICKQNRLSSVSMFKVDCVKIVWIIKWYEKLFRKDDDVTLTELEKIFTSPLGLADDVFILFAVEAKLAKRYGFGGGKHKKILKKTRKIKKMIKSGLPPKLADGKLLREEVGLKELRLYGRFLDALREKQLQGDLTTKAQAISYLKSLK